MTVNLLGQRFGKLVVEAPFQTPGRRIWLCRCDCGGTITVPTGNLKKRSYTNCGCSISESRQRASLKHGHNRLGYRTKEYRTWAHIVGRCRDPNDGAWHYYGARGITVCDGWANSFEEFLSDVGFAPSPAHSIDRIDNNQGYQPGNVRWATAAEQARNTRRNVVIDGKCLVDVCAERGLSYDAVQARLRRGHPPHLALSPLTGHAYRAMLSAAPAVEAG